MLTPEEAIAALAVISRLMLSVKNLEAQLAQAQARINELEAPRKKDGEP